MNAPASWHFPEIVAMFHKAQESGIRFPQASFDVPHDTITIYMCMTRSGDILVRDTRKREGSSRFGIIQQQHGAWCPESYGRFHRYGRFVEDHWDGILDCVARELHKFNEDPASFAALYGQRTGNCMFCMRELTQRDSVAVGYGPVCAERYGLPHAGMADEMQRERDEQDALADVEDMDESAPAPEAPFRLNLPAVAGVTHVAATIPGANVTDVPKAQIVAVVDKPPGNDYTDTLESWHDTIQRMGASRFTIADHKNMMRKRAYDMLKHLGIIGVPGDVLHYLHELVDADSTDSSEDK